MAASLPTRILGKTGVELPILGFGTAASGTRLSEREAVRLYEAAFEAGIRYFDTAPDFAGYGQAQRYLGRHLAKRRDDIFLVTKCFEPDGQRALRLLESNLRELQTDHADLVFVHSLGADKMDPREVFGKQGVYEALRYAKRQGLTKWIGISGHSRPRRFVDALNSIELDVLLTAVNCVDRHTYNFEQHVWPLAQRQNLGLLAMKVYGGQGEPNDRQLSRRAMPSNMLDAAFRYALSLPGVAAATIGMATMDELTDNLRRATTFTPLSPSEQRTVLAAGRQLAQQWGDHLGPVV